MHRYIRGTTQTGRLGEKARGQVEMVWTGRRQRGRPKRRFMDAVKEDVQVVDFRVEDTKNRLKCKTVICYGNS